MVGLDWIGLVGEVNGQVIGRAAAGPTIPLPCHAAAQCWRSKVTHIHTLHAAIAAVTTTQACSLCLTLADCLRVSDE